MSEGGYRQGVLGSPYRRGANDGFYFGIYLTCLFASTVLSSSIPFFSLVAIVLIIGVPFLIYKFLRRSYIEDREFSTFSSLWMQGIMIFACGSLISGVVALIYLKWINPDFMVDQIRKVIEYYKDGTIAQGRDVAVTLQEMIDNKLVPSAIAVVIEMIWFSVFSGSLLSLLMSLLVRSRKVKTQEREVE